MDWPEKIRNSRLSLEQRRETYVDCVVEHAMLRDWDEGGLVVRCGVDGREPVRARRETPRYVGRENPILGCRIQALEESENSRIRNLGRRERVHLLDDKVAMARDDALAIQLLRRGKVVLLRIHEVPRVQILDRHCDGERRVGLQNVEVLRVCELGSGHLCAGGNIAHRGRVTRASLNLLAVGNRLADAEVDEVIGGRQRGDLARLGRVFLAVLLEALGNHTSIQALKEVSRTSA